MGSTSAWHYSGVVVAWLYNSTNQSVLLVGLFHSAFNTTTAAFVREFIPATAEDQFLILTRARHLVA